jgi:hypothetical protein
MAFSSQAFRAPSLTSKPKLGKTTVSSSVFRGTAKAVSSPKAIKVPKGMGYDSIYRGSSVDPKSLKQETTPVEQTLVETNRILVEIQNQLAIDFASRIAQDKEEVNKIRSTADKKKRAEAEKGVEAVKKTGSVLSGIGSKIMAPAMGIFDKIKSFLAIVLTGFLVNKALPWLAANEGIITGIFDFLGKHWKKILYLIGGILIFKVVRKIIKIFKAVKAVASFLKKGIKGLFNIFRKGGRVMNAMRGALKGGQGIKGALKAGQTASKRFGAQAAKSAAKKAAMKTAAKAGAKGLGKAVLKKIPLIGLGAGILFGAQRALAGDFVGAGMELASGASGTVPGLGTAASVAIDAALVAKDVGAFDGVGKDGTVLGKDVGDKDTVDAKLTVGETVVPKKQSKEFKPFLNDIINNEGALFKAMDMSFKMQEENIKMFTIINEKFDNVLASFDNIIEGMKSSSGGLTNSGGGMTPSAAAASISPPTGGGGNGGGTDPSTKLAPPTDDGEGTITTLPMLPANGGSKPSSAKSASPQGGDSIPTFDAEDPDNFYVEFIKRQFGIYGV